MEGEGCIVPVIDVARKNCNARRKKYSPLSFHDMAKIIDLTPRQKITILRYMRKKTERG